ncbi:unnamed protein product [Clavelina lepadiformis]|uniref:NADP-dependent oxidoreductase domain-containing protein n=1 Tax=Clavelina lepadiformis TaxID=159417 RepID=A0ABP0EZ30_CLALP
MSSSNIRAILGTMEFGRRLDLERSEAMVNAFIDLQKNASCIELDTAFMYAGGKTEELMGRMDNRTLLSIQIATKVNSWDGKLLNRDSIRKQFATSLKRLQVPSVHLLYLHLPDHQTPITESLEAINELHKEGKFKEFGLSNYAAWQVAEIQTICKMKSWIAPTVYQGMYNCLTRMVEKELFPCLRYYGMRFYAYNPLSGGILTGKHKFEDSTKVEPGRFFGTAKWSVAYRERFWKTEIFDAVSKIQQVLDKTYGNNTVSVAEAAYRWLYHHSLMEGKHGDGLIIGASSMEQFTANMGYTTKGPLEKEVVEVIEECWAMCGYLCADYMR